MAQKSEDLSLEYAHADSIPTCVLSVARVSESQPLALVFISARTIAFVISWKKRGPRKNALQFSL